MTVYTVTPYLWHIELLLVIAVSEDVLLLLYSVQCMYTVTPYLWQIELLLVIAVSKDTLLYCTVQCTVYVHSDPLPVAYRTPPRHSCE